ncbi:probable inactive receptor kinase At5g67200 [Vigna radiata var. radiata]|uniref:Probable inactive receptor kinase At5g67200 n=1 Tax=Vigna radiata var. radiata TaxID=3916 RepID=A0A3Q0FH02_VIGRR|nr:probable inactive receptor kinase At5g67200 [Vigna radiata var. radiata]
MEEVVEDKEVKVRRMKEAHRSGKLVFCCGEVQQYTLEMLMRASAELLGRGSVGTAYKRVLDSRLILTVKRLDGGKSGESDGVVFQRHMEAVGRLRHPNLVPLRAYFQAKVERLVIYDYQPNDSIFNLVDGSHYPFVNINFNSNALFSWSLFVYIFLSSKKKV